MHLEDPYRHLYCAGSATIGQLCQGLHLDQSPSRPKPIFFMEAPAGPFVCGITDLHYFDPDSKDLNPSSHLTARIFYPTTSFTKSAALSWLTSWNSARGYALFPLVLHSGLGISILRGLLTVFCALIGFSVRLPGRWNAPVISSEEQGRSSISPSGSSQKLPLVIFSHGLAGQRGTYSQLALDLASRGYFLVAIEHSDGTASVAELSGPADKMIWDHSPRELPRNARGKWRWYGGLGDHVEVGRPQWRLEEVKTAMRLIGDLNSGSRIKGLQISACSEETITSWITGRVDVEKTIVIGHSYGGATASWASSCIRGVIAGVALDPWWDALPDNAAVLNKWENQKSPLLVIASEEWSMPLASSEGPESNPLAIKMSCGYDRRERIMSVAAESGAGCLRVVPKESNHHSFDDIMLLMEKRGVMAIAGCINFQKPKISPTQMHRQIVKVIELFLDNVRDGKALSDERIIEYRKVLGEEMTHEIVLSSASKKQPRPQANPNSINLNVDTL